MADILPPTSERNTKALLEKQVSGVTPVDAEGKILGRIHEVLAEQKGTAALESMKVVGVGQERIDLATSKLVVLRERDKSPKPDPKDRDDENKAKLEAKQRTVKANGERVETYLKEGFEKADKAEIRSQIEASFPNLWPEAATELATMKRTKPAEYAAFVDTIANDPRYAGVVQEVLKDATDPEKKLPEIPQSLREKLVEVTNRLVAIDRDLLDKGKELGRYQGDFSKEFGDMHKPGDEGTLGKRLTELSGREESNKVTVDEAVKTIADLNRRIDQAERTLAQPLLAGKHERKDDVIQAEMDKNRDALLIAEGKRDTARKELSELESIRTRKKELQENQERLQSETNALTDEKNTLTAKKSDVQADMDMIELDRMHMEGEYTRTLDEAFKIASEKYFTGRYEDADKAQMIALEEHKKAATTDEEKKVYDDVLLRRWRVMKNGRRGAPDKKIINDDIATLLGSPKGPELLLAKLGIPEAIREKVQPEVIQTLLQERLKIGGFKQHEVEYIADSRWGNGLLEAAVKNNDALKGHLESLKAQGILQKTSWEGLKEFADRHPVLKKLLVSLLIVGVGVTVPVGLITALAGQVRPMEGSMANLIGNKIGEAAVAASNIPLGAKAGEIATAVGNAPRPTVPKIT